MMTERASATISMQGTLDKQGRMRTWNWKKYWFVLKDNELTYYKEDSRRSSSGLLDLSTAHSVKITTKGPTSGFPFEIITKSRTHVFSAATEESRTKWIDSLRKAMMFKRSTSSVTSSTSSVSSMNRQLSFSTPSCDSISDEDDQMIYENADEVNGYCSSDEVFIQNSASAPKTPTSLNRSPPAIPKQGEEPEDPLYATPGDIKASPSNNVIIGSNDYEYVSNISNNTKQNGHSASAYSDVPAQDGKQKVEMRKSALRRLAGNNSIKASAIDSSVSLADPGYEQVTTVPRTPSDYRTEPVQISPLQSDTDTSGNSEEYDRASTITIIASQADNVDSLPSNLHFEPIPKLPHPREELTFGGAFDDIRRFIANNRGPSEMYAMPNKSNNNGDAIRKLRQFLASIETQSPV